MPCRRAGPPLTCLKRPRQTASALVLNIGKRGVIAIHTSNSPNPPPGPEAVDESALVRLITHNVSGVRAIVLTGSLARGVADPFSDVDLVVLWEALDRCVQVGRFSHRLVEAVYLPIAPLRHDPHPRPSRATMAGARILYDPDGLAAGWLAKLSPALASPPPAFSAQQAYSRFEIEQLLATITGLADEDPDLAVLLRGYFVAEVMGYCWRRARSWPPTLRRQLPALATVHPRAHTLLRAALRATTPSEIVRRCRAVFDEIVAPADPDLPDFAAAPLWPLDRVD